MKNLRIIDLCDPQQLADLEAFSNREFKENAPKTKKPNPQCKF